MALDELYRQVILDHYRSPRNRDPISDPDASAEGYNPLCGDEVTVELAFDNAHVASVSVRSQGCSISQSSASMMSEAIKSKTVDEIRDLTLKFKTMLDIERHDAESDGDGSAKSDIIDPDQPGKVLGDLEALQGVRRYPVRIKCADLPWTTLTDALLQLD